MSMDTAMTNDQLNALNLTSAEQVSPTPTPSLEELALDVATLTTRLNNLTEFLRVFYRDIE